MSHPIEPPTSRPPAAPLRGEPAPVCPACGSHRIASIVYGTPSHHVLQQYLAGWVVLGGICHAEDAPAWYCRECERRWRDPR